MNPFRDLLSPLRGRHSRHGGHHHRHHHDHHHFGSHGRGGRGHGAGDGVSGGPGRGLGGFERGRKLGGDDLQLLILALLGEQPAHGYELIKSFEQRSQGYYVPSPGMIYPALSYLEEVGHASVEQDGAKKRYSLTAAGRARIEEHRAAIDAMWAQLAQFGERMARLREDGDGAGDFTPRGGRGADDALHQAAHALRSALHAGRSATPEQRQRVAEILVAATTQIRSALAGN